ncbi:MAG: helix-turn-helix transcriptional regulator [Fimbriimonadaceae bacterium]|nr:helix-turn-helix transcriptional regulator [Fimbriimonadaceae bacterium]QYK57337.1 MAG: helix-turn-helix transcriptional regulator [Fimbriimonadaceae bacterium]
MDATELARLCKALGDPTRARVFLFLCQCCAQVALDDDGGARPADGPTVGEVCCHITGSPQPSSNLSFHLKELREAGLVTTERRGQRVVCRIDRATLARLAETFAAAQSCCGPDPERTNR